VSRRNFSKRGRSPVAARDEDSCDVRYYRRIGQFVLLACITAGLLWAAAGDGGCSDIEIRVENFTVPPATGPLANIRVHNHGDSTCDVSIQPKFPDGWQWTPGRRTMSIGPGEVKRAAFAIEKTSDVEANRYPIEVIVLNGSEKKVHRQEVVWASVPYFKPKIDGKFKDWADAIGVTFTAGDKKTIVSTYWNKKQFCLYVQVEEDKLLRHKKGAGKVDAVQFALARRDAVTGSEPSAKADRYEFVLIDSAGMFARAKCFCLITPGEALSKTVLPRPLESLELKEAKVVVKRKGNITHYECAIPFSVMPQIKPDVGREICFSILVHDPDGTGVRDWGEAAGLGPNQRNRFAWCAWGKVDWSSRPACDGKVEWGLCSSKH